MVWVWIVLGVYGLILVAIAFISVHPYRIPFWISPGVLGAPQEDVEFLSEDGALIRGWWVGSDRSPNVAVLAHGYMMNRCELTPEAYLLWQHGISCLLIDLRSHGKSRGPLCSLGFKERADVLAAARFARQRSPDGRIVAIGSSMGASAMAFAAAQYPASVDVLVLDSAYGKLSSAILGWWRFLGGPLLAFALAPMPVIAWPLIGLNPFLVDVREALEKIGEMPVLFFHGKRDNLALPAQALRNFDTVKGPKHIVWFEGCGHSEGRWEQPEKHHQELLQFLATQGILPEALQASSQMPSA